MSETGTVGVAASKTSSMLTVEFRFEYGQQVRIVPLDRIIGRVRQVLSDARGQQYDVRYFHNGEEKTVWFFEDELEEMPRE